MTLRLWDQIIGHNEVIENLHRLLSSERVPSSLMFLGPSGMGKKKVALAFAQSLVCEKNNKACGVCGACVRVAKEQSENLFLVTAQAGTHKIETMREVIRWLSLSGTGRGRIIIIDDAHLMTAQAANALLKSVEEPPEATHFIFIAPSRERLISTLRSRSQAVQFRPLTVEQMIQLLPEKDTELRDKSAELLSYSMGHELDAAIEHLRDGIGGREEAKKITDYWLQFIRDLSVARIGGASPLQGHTIHLLENNFASYSLEHLSDMGMDVLRLQKDLLRNADIQLSFENTLRHWRNHEVSLP